MKYIWEVSDLNQAGRRVVNSNNTEEFTTTWSNEFPEPQMEVITGSMVPMSSTVLHKAIEAGEDPRKRYGLVSLLDGQVLRHNVTVAELLEFLNSRGFRPKTVHEPVSKEHRQWPQGVK